MGKLIRTIGIAGGGKMGQNLFQYLSEFDFGLVFYARNNHEKLEKKHHRKLGRQLKNGILNETTYREKIKNQVISSNLAQLSKVDLFIECIPENLEFKNGLFASLDNILSPHTIIASNSSSILPEKFNLSTDRKKNFLGLHFFYPINLKNIVELVVTNETSKETIESSIQFLKSIKRDYLLQNSRSAFILNKIMLDVQAAAYNLSEESSCHTIDKAVKEQFLPIGIFEMMDHIGLDVLSLSIINYLENIEDKDLISSLSKKLQELVNQGNLGIKTGKGFYNYSKDVKEEFKDLSTDKLEEISTYLKGIYKESIVKYSVLINISKEELEKAMKEYLAF